MPSLQFLYILGNSPCILFYFNREHVINLCDDNHIDANSKSALLSVKAITTFIVAVNTCCKKSFSSTKFADYLHNSKKISNSSASIDKPVVDGFFLLRCIISFSPGIFPPFAHHGIKDTLLEITHPSTIGNYRNLNHIFVVQRWHCRVLKLVCNNVPQNVSLH